MTVSYPIYCGGCRCWEDSEVIDGTGQRLGLCEDGTKGNYGFRYEGDLACIKGILISVTKDIEREKQTRCTTA